VLAGREQEAEGDGAHALGLVRQNLFASAFNARRLGRRRPFLRQLFRGALGRGDRPVVEPHALLGRIPGARFPHPAGLPPNPATRIAARRERGGNEDQLDGVLPRVVAHPVSRFDRRGPAFAQGPQVDEKRLPQYVDRLEAA
jgi:hypothetical protein